MDQRKLDRFVTGHMNFYKHLFRYSFYNIDIFPCNLKSCNKNRILSKYNEILWGEISSNQFVFDLRYQKCA